MTVNCRFCGTSLTTTLIDLGDMPLANSILQSSDQINKEELFPLHVMVCDACHLAQSIATIPSNAIFNNNYAYFSSYSTGWVAHAKRYTEAMIKRFGLDTDSHVLEVASNDGYLLQHFVKRGISALGVDPAGNCAAEAEKKGVQTRVAFFDGETARALAGEGLKADLTVANNVLAHVPDINTFVEGFREILKPEGVSTFEFPHLLNLINDIQFDTIYHEHYSYLSLLAVERVFLRHGLRAFDVETLPTHGGSLRVFACLNEASHKETENLHAIRRLEAEAELDKAKGYESYAARVNKVKDEFLAFLATAKQEGKSVAGYGAAAKGATFMNFCGLSASDLPFVADRNIHKQGCLIPGVHAPIVEPSEILKQKPDYLIVLPWNLSDEVAQEQAQIRSWGGQFVTAIPKLRIF